MSDVFRHGRGRLPVRVAHPRAPGLDGFDDAYFDLLVRCGYEGLYLQDSPFDHLSGNHGPFRRTFHLISLYDLARGPEQARYQDYVHEVARRAARHGLRVYLACWEPRLPHAAWADTPPEWRGRGGFIYGGCCNVTSFCWSVPEAVAYWKAMARDAFAALPELTGVHLGVMDNEANFCDATCPRCRGETVVRQGLDIYGTFADIRRARGGDFRIAVYDWWLPDEILPPLQTLLGPGTVVIGRSSQGHTQTMDGVPVEGTVADMTMVMGGCGPGIRAQRDRLTPLGFRIADMTAWSHAGESWWLPAPPAPAYAIEKLNALEALGAAGWYDFDCGAIEPGSIADAVAAWTREPEATPETLLANVWRGLYGSEAACVAEAYADFQAGVRYFPVAYNDLQCTGFSSRLQGLGLTLFGPWRVRDFRFVDSCHQFNWFAPYNLVTATSVPAVLPFMENVVAFTGRAWERIRAVPPATPAIVREQAAFEIHHRHYRAIRNYFKVGGILLDAHAGRRDAVDRARALREVAVDERANLAAVAAWMARHPDAIVNPVWSLRGVLEECWPEDLFTPDLFGPKRASLEELEH